MSINDKSHIMFTSHNSERNCIRKNLISNKYQFRNENYNYLLISRFYLFQFIFKKFLHNSDLSKRKKFINEYRNLLVDRNYLHTNICM